MFWQLENNFKTCLGLLASNIFSDYEVLTYKEENHICVR